MLTADGGSTGFEENRTDSVLSGAAEAGFEVAGDCKGLLCTSGAVRRLLEGTAALPDDPAAMAAYERLDVRTRASICSIKCR